MADSIFDFDPIAANNTSFAGTPYGPNQLYHNQIDNLFRAYAGALGGFVDDLGAVATPTGTATAIAVTLSQGFTAYGTAAGQIRHGTLIALKMPLAATAAATLDVNSLGTKKIRRQGDAAIEANDWLANGVYFFRYDTAYDTANGAWVLLNAASSGVTFATNAAAVTGTSTVLSVNPANLGSLLNAGTDNTGGATITMGDGGYFNLITSTTAITAFAFTNDAVGRTARVRFNTVRTLTHNGTSLIIPGAANVTTAAGDIAQIRSLGGGNFVVEWYTRGAVTPGGGWEMIDAASVSGASSYAKTGLSGYRMLRLKLHLATSADGTSINLRTSSNNGSSYDSTASDYYYQFSYAQSTTSAGLASSSATAIPLYIGNVGNATGEMVVCDVTISEFNQALYCGVVGTVGDVPSSGTPEAGSLFARRVQATARNAIQITPGTGTFTGFIVLEGLRG